MNLKSPHAHRRRWPMPTLAQKYGQVVRRELERKRAELYDVRESAVKVFGAGILPEGLRAKTRRLLHRIDDGAGEFVCARSAAHVARADFAFAIDLEHRALDAVSRLALADVAEH